MQTELPPALVQRPPREDGPRLTLVGHLEELRRRLGLSLAVWLMAVGVSAWQLDRIIGWLRRPIEPELPHFAYFSPTEPLVAYVKVAVLSGFILVMPFILWQLWVFVRPGLSRRERFYGLAFAVWGSALFVAGGAFAYGFLLPVSLRFLLGIGTQYLQPVISIDRYLSFVTTLIFWCGAVFELPVVLFALATVGIVTPEWLRQQRPYAILVLVTIAAIVTPTTDPVNLMLLAVPMVGLYEISILVCRFAMPDARHGGKR